MRTSGPTPRSGPVDAVRGLALLGSAVATGLLWLSGRRLGPGYRPLDPGPADRFADVVTGLVVDNRVLAVFALLLGWSLAVRLHGTAGGVADRPGVAGWPWVPVLRRAGLLLGLGALHAVLLLQGDVLGVLAVLLVLALPLALAGTRLQLLVAVVAVPTLLVQGAADGLGGLSGFPDPPTDYLLSVVDRTGTWLLALVLLPFTQLGLLLPLLAGVRLARAGWLEHPRRHARALLLTGAAASAVGLLGAVPWARVLASTGGTTVPAATGAGVLSSVTGPAGALGAVCLGVLVASRLPQRLLAVPAALGRHGLPAYLAHSLVLALVLAPWAGGLGVRWGSAAVSGLAVAVWAVSLLVAGVLAARRDRPAQPSERQGLLRSSAT